MNVKIFLRGSANMTDKSIHSSKYSSTNIREKELIHRAVDRGFGPRGKNFFGPLHQGWTG
jgi:hypothetical protein